MLYLGLGIMLYLLAYGIACESSIGIGRIFYPREMTDIATTAEYLQGYLDWIEKRDSEAAQQVQLYEQLREYHFPEPEKIYRALKSNVGGKTFISPTHKVTIKKGKLCITSES